MVEALGIPLLAYEGFEADDIVATVARLTDELGGRCFIVSGDKDCRQLITERVKLYNIRKNEVIDREVLRQEWGVAPNQVVDYQALVGDSTDNVPGVPLIGPKAARDLLEKYGTLENILDHVDEVGGAAKKENLKKYREQALLSRKLVQLDAHVPLADFLEIGSARRAAITPGHARCSRNSASAVLPNGCRPISRQRVGGTAAQSDVPPRRTSRSITTIDTPEALAALVTEMRRQKQISVDTETTHIWPRWAEIVGISLSWDEQRAYYLPLRGPEGSRLLEPQADARRLAAGAGRPGHRQARPEPEIRSHRAPQRRHRTGRNALRHHGCQLPAWTPGSGTITSTTWRNGISITSPSRSKN